ncbi:unnamed protein product [Protopolystoma xenopodis]|uniref:Uncharacterized protein n=1 Tax=Protopolystoma xenopodis TaxID=117903 RepID=A0A3S5AWE9_9PLAT|nr:unnamed protein product [Protopolystoma xenopodis]
MLQPYGVAYDAWTRRLLVADHVNHRIQACRVNPGFTTFGFPEVSRASGVTLADLDGTRGGGKGFRTLSTSKFGRSGQFGLGNMEALVNKSGEHVWHPIAVAIGVPGSGKLVVSEALGTIKVVKISAPAEVNNDSPDTTVYHEDIRN